MIKIVREEVVQLELIIKCRIGMINKINEIQKLSFIFFQPALKIPFFFQPAILNILGIDNHKKWLMFFVFP